MKAMTRVRGNAVLSKDIPNYTWNTDLVYWEGPLLSLFKSDLGEDALFSWLDCSSTKNRWCIVPVGRKTLRQYLSQEITLLQVYKEADQLIVFDADRKMRRSGLVITSYDLMPLEYLPDEESYLTDEISTDAAKMLASEETENFNLGLNGELYIDDLSTIPKIFQQLYSFHYGLDHLHRAAIRGTLSNLIKDWSGGISAVNIFTGLRKVTPSIHRATIKELIFSSPGHIKLNLLPGLANRIVESTNIISNDDLYIETEQLYKDTYRFFRKHKISGFEDERTNFDYLLTEGVNKELAKFIETFFELMGWQGYENNFYDIQANPLQQVRVLLAYYRRLRKLRPYIKSGRLSVGSSPLESPQLINH